jgi:hypothetical protein
LPWVIALLQTFTVVAELHTVRGLGVGSGYLYAQVLILALPP